jgi:hypothetical protein
MSTAPFWGSRNQGEPQEITTRVQALCLSGGGYRGLYTARILEHLQTLTPHPLRAHFRFIAGTSIGALIAAALSAGIPPGTIRATLETVGPRLFARRPLHGLYQWFRAPYESELLSECLTQLFDTVTPRGILDRPLHDQPLALVVIATSATNHEPRIYAGDGIAFELDRDITLREALLASAAAPTYFPAKRVRHETLVDGGLIANAPDAIAIGLLQRRFGAQLTDCHVLSVGTCAPKPRVGAVRSIDSGLIGWLRRKPNIIAVTLDAQERLTIHILDQLLGDRFLRIDSEPRDADAVAIAALDQCERRTTEALLRLADQKFRSITADPRLAEYFSGT